MHDFHLMIGVIWLCNLLPVNKFQISTNYADLIISNKFRNELITLHSTDSKCSKATITYNYNYVLKMSRSVVKIVQIEF
jgi:hypothetical protein